MSSCTKSRSRIKTKNQAIALELWTKCISSATPRDFSQSEGDDWYGLANKRLLKEIKSLFKTSKHQASIAETTGKKGQKLQVTEFT
jgi:hypothetical protein